MNATADQLGMNDTHYTDPSGLDPDTVSTARDQVILAGKAMAVLLPDTSTNSWPPRSPCSPRSAAQACECSP